jgi:hypothetical protein
MMSRLARRCRLLQARTDERRGKRQSGYHSAAGSAANTARGDHAPPEGRGAGPLTRKTAVETEG